MDPVLDQQENAIEKIPVEELELGINSRISSEKAKWIFPRYPGAGQLQASTPHPSALKQHGALNCMPKERTDFGKYP